MSDPYTTPPPTYPATPEQPSLGDPRTQPAPDGEPLPPTYPPATPSYGDDQASGGSGKAEELKGKASEAAGTAKEEAAGVAADAKSAASQVGGTAKDEAAKVASSAKDQASSLLSEATSNLRTQTDAGKGHAAAGLRGFSSELASLAEGSQEQGAVSDLARQASQRLGGAAGWLEDRDLDGVLSDVQDFARRRPLAFIGLALGAGVVVGRLSRALKDAPSSSSTTAPTALERTSAASGRHSAPDADGLGLTSSTSTSGTSSAAGYQWGTPGTAAPAAEPGRS